MSTTTSQVTPGNAAESGGVQLISIYGQLVRKPDMVTLMIILTFMPYELSNSILKFEPSSLVTTMAKEKTGRVYLTDEEKTILAGILEEWNSKPNKKARDDFISAETLPKIQQLNASKFGPEIISKDKVADLLWNKRVQVSVSSILKGYC